MKKKRRIHLGRIILISVLLAAVIIGSLYLYISLNTKEEEPFDVNSLHINELDYSEAKTLDLDLYSKEYLLIRLNDFKVLYASNNSDLMYPASLTKVLTMNSVLDICDDIKETASYSYVQYDCLIEDNASLAGLKPEKDYTVEELLYGLILPSGGDAAVALENYAANKGHNLIELMNNKCIKLGLVNSHFTNPTGLHNDLLYTTLDDYARIVIDTLNSSEAKKVLKAKEHELDGKTSRSTLYGLFDRDDGIEVCGGKTGYTPEAGMNLMALYKANNRSYLLLLGNAPGSPYRDGSKHLDDANKILESLY